MVSDSEALGKVIERAMEANGLKNIQLANLAGVSDGSIRNLRKFGVDPDAPVPTIQLLVAVAGVLGLHPVRVLQMAGHLPSTAYSRVGALGEYVGVRFESLSRRNQDKLLDMLADLEREDGLESFGEVVKRLIPEAEALGQRRLSFLDQVGLALGHLTGISTEELLLKGVQRRLAILFPDEAIGQEQIAVVAQHPVVQALMAILLPRRDILPGLEKLYFLMFFNEDRLLPDDRAEILRDTWRLLERAVARPNG